MAHAGARSAADDKRAALNQADPGVIFICILKTIYEATVVGVLLAAGLVL